MKGLTKFQQWLRSQGACGRGRRAVGSRTLTEFWFTCDVPAYLGWLVRHAGGANASDFSSGGLSCGTPGDLRSVGQPNSKGISVPDSAKRDHATAQHIRHAYPLPYIPTAMTKKG